MLDQSQTLVGAPKFPSPPICEWDPWSYHQKVKHHPECCKGDHAFFYGTSAKRCTAEGHPKPSTFLSHRTLKDRS